MGVEEIKWVEKEQSGYKPHLEVLLRTARVVSMEN